MTDEQLQHQHLMIQRMVDYYTRGDGKKYRVIVVDPKKENRDDLVR